ncbi:MAG: hypothetical protein NVS9B13_16850 [Candidatus Acidiferrum sp.]
MTLLSQSATAPASLRILLDGLIDYAGIFPPAGLAMRPAVQNFETYRHSGQGWMLGRFIVPASRLEEFEVAYQGLPADKNGAPAKWRISALIGADFTSELSSIREFNRRHSADRPGRDAFIDAIELKAVTPDDIRNTALLLPSGLQTFFEISPSHLLSENLAAIHAAGKCAKVRTGGETAPLFPSTEILAAFISACARAEVCFKATAGLHHPLRATHRFTYEPDSPSGRMHGFLNVFLAASFMLYGMDATAAAELLAEEYALAFRFVEAGVSWRSETLSNTQLLRARQSFCAGFGSCSFREPLEDLHALHLL